MHSVAFRTRRSEDATTPLRSGLLNPNGGGQGLDSGFTQRPWITPLLLWLLTLCLWLPGLGNLPLRDWDEGRVATVARSTTTLLPVKWEQPYLNKPPGLHLPMGVLIRRYGEAEVVVRLLPALLSSLAIPLILTLRRSLGGPDAEQRALLAAAVLMTLLPMARHGRLAMLDGTLVSCTLLLWWGWLGARDQPWRALMAGLAASGVLLLKPPALLGFGLIAALVGGRRSWPRGGSWMALGIGLLPGVSWHLWHWKIRGSDALLMWGGQGLARITNSVGDGLGWWTPWVELLEGGWPWLLLLPAGLTWAWRNRWNPVGRWELGLLISTAALVMPLRTQLPWYSHLLWPPLALLCGDGLHELIKHQRHRWVSGSWQAMGMLLLLAGLAGKTAGLADWPDLSLLLAGGGLLAGGWFTGRSDRLWRRRGLLMLLLGWGLALMSLWSSGLWLWELNESWDPRPVASEVRSLPTGTSVWLEGPTRPSMGWYAGRELRRFRKGNAPPDDHWLVSPRQRTGCQLAAPAVPGAWQLWRCR